MPYSRPAMALAEMADELIAQTVCVVAGSDAAYHGTVVGDLSGMLLLVFGEVSSVFVAGGVFAVGGSAVEPAGVFLGDCVGRRGVVQGSLICGGW